MKPVLLYCYDAYCGWCYGFSPVMKQIAENFANEVATEVLSGGMVIAHKPIAIGATAGYIQEAYKAVETTTGIVFGQDYLWHIFNPDLSDWFPNSEKPAIALCIFKEYYPEKQVAFAADLQYALHFEGRDLCDNAAYEHLLEQYGIDKKDFYTKLESAEYKEKAYYEFQLCKQLQVTGFPCVLLQASETKFYLVARGYTPYTEVAQRITNILATLKA